MGILREVYTIQLSVRAKVRVGYPTWKKDEKERGREKECVCVCSGESGEMTKGGERPRSGETSVERQGGERRSSTS